MTAVAYSSDETGPVAGRVALITGGTRKIGRAIALWLARAGYSLVLLSRQRDAAAEETLALLEALGAPALHLAADVTVEAAVQAAVGSAVARFGRVDCVVHGASVRGHASLAEMSYGQWREVLATNLDAAYLCARAALPHFPAAGGRIVFLTGTAAVLGMAQRAHVGAAKAGLAGLARALATELAPRRITVNCVSPGVIDTSGAAPGAPLPAALRQQVRIPADRLGHPDEIASAVAWLVSESGGYVTGQEIHVNGGMFYG